MDVTVHIDEIVIDNDGPDREDAVTASLRPALRGVLDEEALSDAGRAITGTISGAVPEPWAAPGPGS